MPGVDYRQVQLRVPMAKVLELLRLPSAGALGPQFRGPCPLHASRSRRSRSFSAHLLRGVCHCFRCGFAGNQVQLWGAWKGLTVYEAAVDLCRAAGVEVPWIERWPRGGPRREKAGHGRKAGNDR